MPRVPGSAVVAVAAVLASAAVSMAAVRPPSHVPAPRADRTGSTRLLDVPYLSQTEDLCGGAALAMVLRYWGERQVFAEDFAELVDRSAAGIRTDVLAAAARRRGWQTLPFSAAPSGDWIRHHLDRGRPLIALIEERPGTYHYVVIVGWTGDQVIAHDPARAPFRVLSRSEFERAWAPAGYWALLLLPPDGRPSEREIVSPSAEAEPPAAIDDCGALVQESVRRARTGDVPGAENGLLAAISLCPRDAAPWRELGGIRFLQSRWAEASGFAERAVRLDAPERHDAHTWDLLATSRFLNEEPEAALEAWNRIGRPHVDIVHVEGAQRTRRPIIGDLLDLPPRALLTAEKFRRAGRRLQELPSAAVARVRYRPLEDGLVDVETIIRERPTLPWGVLPIAATAGRALLLRELQLDVAGPTGSGELWSAMWRWWEARPRVAFGLAVPAPGRLPGVARLEGSWERQSYATPIGTAGPGTGGIHQDDRRRAALSLADWATGNLRWEAGGALDRWGDDSHLSIDVALDARLARDRLSLGVATAAWAPLGPGKRFVTNGVTSAWRSARDSIGPAWSAFGGLTAASDAAPFDLWPGAGTGHARAPLLRAHPLLHDGVIQGQVFGRRLAHGSVQYERPLRTGPAAGLRLAAFADAAKAWRRIDHSRPSPLHVDVGAGLRAAVPGISGTVRIDLSRGMRDGRVVLSAGWQSQWPGQ